MKYPGWVDEMPFGDVTAVNRYAGQKMFLQEDSRVHVIGGGPAGSFFAIHLLRQAAKIKKKIAVTIIDKKISFGSPDPTVRLRGCNFCAGVISPGLYKEMTKHDIYLPGSFICEEFTHIWIHGRWKNFPIKVPAGQTLCSVFRGSLPFAREDSASGFDTFLLNRALDLGATLVPGSVSKIDYTRSGRPRLRIKKNGGENLELVSDFLCIATGVNSNPKSQFGKDDLYQSLKKINPYFEPPQTRPALVFELKPGRDYLEKYMNRELYLIATGSRQLRLEHIALITKGDYLTVSMVGSSIDKGSFPLDTERFIRAFLALPHIQNILPGLTFENTPVICSCTPRMSVKPSVSPFQNRIAMIGDALGARLYRDGLYSAFISAKALADHILHGGIDKKDLEVSNSWICRWIEEDNRHCKMIFHWIQKALKSEILSRILYQTFATEMKLKKMENRPLGGLLWKIGSGTADYRTVLNEFKRPPVLRSVLTGGFKTIRNMLTELFFGLSWGDYGRYPTVVLKEKRDAIKKSIQPLTSFTLNQQPEMERMYAIRIRATSQVIFDELSKFGQPDSKFLRLRFVDVKQTAGAPNRLGSIVTYRAKMLPVAMNIHLRQVIPNTILSYEPDELFTKNGMLLFEIRQTRGGNNRLVIYTAFDYKKGDGLLSRIFFNCLRYLFPDFAHDVVWNHALCTIKAEAEKQITP